MKAVYYYQTPYELVRAVKEKEQAAYSIKVKCIGAVETGFRPYGEGLRAEGRVLRWGSYSYPFDLIERITVRLRESWGERSQYTFQVENSYIVSLMAEEPVKKLNSFLANEKF